MTEHLIVALRGSRIGCIEFDSEANSREFSYDAAYLASPEACPISLALPRKADGLSAEMSDEGHPSPIYVRIGEVIREQIARVKGN